MVCCTSGDWEESRLAFYTFFKTRKKIFVNTVLGNSYSGFLETDGLKAYESYGKTAEHCVNGNCNTHARRAFVTALGAREDYRELMKLSNPAERKEFLEKNPALNIIMEIITIYNGLYDVERFCKESSMSCSGYREMRQSVYAPIFDSLEKKIRKASEMFEEQSSMGKACSYFLERVKSIKAYLEDGQRPISNDKAERKIKPFVMSRKNFLYSRTAWGAAVTAIYFTIIQSAIINNLDPYRYLVWLLNNLRGMKLLEEEEMERVKRKSDWKSPIGVHLTQKVKDFLRPLLPNSSTLPKELYVKAA